jgi:hypothetical protein
LLDELLRDLTSSYREDKALQVGVVLTLNPHFRSTPIDRHIAGPAALVRFMPISEVTSHSMD